MNPNEACILPRILPEKKTFPIAATRMSVDVNERNQSVWHIQLENHKSFLLQPWTSVNVNERNQPVSRIRLDRTPRVLASGQNQRPCTPNSRSPAHSLQQDPV